MPIPTRMLLWDIVERHFDEAEFLWGQWEHSLVSPSYTLEAVARGPEERLLAHIDGLVVNGPEVARRLLIPALAHGEPQRVSAAATALLQSPGEEGLEAVVTALRTLPQQRSPLTRALACAERPAVLNCMHELLRDPDLDVVAAASEVLIFHHAPLGTALPRLLASDDPVNQVLGMKALAEGPPSLRDPERLLVGLAHEVPSVASAAMEVGCRLGFGPAWQRVRERAAGADRMAMLLLALGGGPAEYRELLAALSNAARRPSALWALGFVGTPETVDASLDWLNDRQVGPLAGEVFTVVTGVNLAEANLPVDQETEALDHVPEDDLPLPDPVKVRHWWMQHRGAFTDGQRYLMGEPRSLTGLLTALLRGSMRRRSALLLDLQLRSPEKRRLILQPRAPTRQQYAELAAIRLLEHAEVNAGRSLF